MRKSRTVTTYKPMKESISQRKEEYWQILEKDKETLHKNLTLWVGVKTQEIECLPSKYMKA
jgi:hypothetical protein